jgi:hypothetical protein
MLRHDRRCMRDLANGDTPARDFGELKVHRRIGRTERSIPIQKYLLSEVNTVPEIGGSLTIPAIRLRSHSPFLPEQSPDKAYSL